MNTQDMTNVSKTSAIFMLRVYSRAHCPATKEAVKNVTSRSKNVASDRASQLHGAGLGGQCARADALVRPQAGSVRNDRAPGVAVPCRGVARRELSRQSPSCSATWRSINAVGRHVANAAPLEPTLSPIVITGLCADERTGRMLRGLGVCIMRIPPPNRKLWLDTERSHRCIPRSDGGKK